MAVAASSLIATLAACRAQAPSTPPPAPAPAVDKAVADLQAKSARFAPTDLTADITALPPNEREALAHMVRAAQVMDALFLEQAWAGNETMLYSLIKDESPVGKARLHEFLINKGPWSRLDHNAVFIPGAPEKPPSANYYPEGATKAEVEKWIDSLGGAEKTRATGFFTTIRRGPDGRFVAVPYSTEYQGELAIAAQHLRAAAAATAQPTLKAFLESRAAAFVSNDYYDSDVKWMELDATIEPTIGPYEVYEDEWFNYKAAFEAFITVKDKAESDKLQKFRRRAAGDREQPADRSEVPQSEARRPRADRRRQHRVLGRRRQSRRADRGLQPAQRRARDSRKGQQAGDAEEQPAGEVRQGAAADLKGGARVRRQGNIAFDAFFTHILMHELMHGLGPHDINVGGRDHDRAPGAEGHLQRDRGSQGRHLGPVRAAVPGRQGTARQDASRRPCTRRSWRRRSARCASAINEAHGRGQAIQLNYLLDNGAFKVNGDGTFTVDAAKIRDGVTALTREIMTLQAEGSYAKARQMIDTLGVLRPQAKAVLDKLTSVPVDIEPRFVTAIDLLK